jgi:hypothetical protein
MWSGVGSETVTVTVAGALHEIPSNARYVNVSTPANPFGGMYLTRQ